MAFSPWVPWLCGFHARVYNNSSGAARVTRSTWSGLAWQDLAPAQRESCYPQAPGPAWREIRRLWAIGIAMAEPG